MHRAITGFHCDEHGDWVADLECGHAQHVRHKPPFVERPWVTTAVGRQMHIGTLLVCVLCPTGSSSSSAPGEDGNSA